MQLRASIEQINALNQDLLALLPDYLAPHVLPGLLQESTLTLFTNHNACAARLRHLAPGLTQSLQQRGWLIQNLKIRIRPQLPPLTHQPAPIKQAHLTATGFAQLQQLSEQLEPSPLQSALNRMVSRYQNSFNSCS